MATTEKRKAGLRLIGLHVRGFKRVEALDLTLDGKHLVLRGKNASGKTSVLDAIWSALGGMKTKDIPEPIHQGSDQAVVTLDLGDYRVTRHWSEAGTRLVVEAAGGERVKRPQELLDGFLGSYALDPVAFLTRRPQDQVDDVLAICGVEAPAAEVERITGEKHAQLAGESASTYLERLSADERGIYYVRRREAGRVADQKSASLEEARQVLATFGPPADADAPTSADEIITRLDQLTHQQQLFREAQAAVAAADLDCRAAQQRLVGIRQDRERAFAAAKDLERRIIQLKAELQMVDAEATVLTDRIAVGDGVVCELIAESRKAAERASAMEDPALAIANCRLSLSESQGRRDGLAKRQHQVEQVNRLAQEVEQARAQHKQIEDTLSALRHLRRHLLDGVDLGVPGLELGDGELRLNGVSFRQASQAERVRIAAAVAMRQHPQLRILRVDDGEHLDQQGREQLLRIAAQDGFQVVLARVTDEEGLRVEIVEGAHD